MLEPKKGIRGHRAIALTSVMSKWCATCIILRLTKKGDRRLEAVARGWYQWHQLSAPSSTDDAAASETLGVATSCISHHCMRHREIGPTFQVISRESHSCQK